MFNLMPLTPSHRTKVFILVFSIHRIYSTPIRGINIFILILALLNPIHRTITPLLLKIVIILVLLIPQQRVLLDPLVTLNPIYPPTMPTFLDPQSRMIVNILLVVILTAQRVILLIQVEQRFPITLIQVEQRFPITYIRLI